MYPGRSFYLLLLKMLSRQDTYIMSEKLAHPWLSMVVEYKDCLDHFKIGKYITKNTQHSILPSVQDGGYYTSHNPSDAPLSQSRTPGNESKMSRMRHGNDHDARKRGLSANLCSELLVLISLLASTNGADYHLHRSKKLSVYLLYSSVFFFWGGGGWGYSQAV